MRASLKAKPLLSNFTWITVKHYNKKHIFNIRLKNFRQKKEKVTPLLSCKKVQVLINIKEVKKGNLPPFDKQIWQRSFYDHIIRKNESLNKIREYIIINPQEWHKDKFHINNYSQ